VANLNVTYDEMRQAAGRLRQGKDDIHNTLGELKALVDNLVSSGYSTDLSSPAFRDTYDSFTTGTKQAVDALDGLAQYLEVAAQTLEETDSSLANAINS
jgi:WXG100 family type VII secretion target|tara:strand:- start:13 stop:309 length:297 start_codon:yes stop_codon:yes gene_type:complete